MHQFSSFSPKIHIPLTSSYFSRARMTTYMQKEYEAALELEERPVLNEVKHSIFLSPMSNPNLLVLFAMKYNP